jgi:glycosyltransferase involved in cell wall biosynthesis
MISIVVCSINQELFELLSRNVGATIGESFEIIRIDNIENNLSICTAYNKGARQANGEIICFIHEDILFHTRHWGRKLIAHFADEEVGVIGVAGSRYKSAFGQNWKDGESPMYRILLKDGIQSGKLLNFNPLNERKSEVVCLDGLFLACKKSQWAEHPFDETNYNGFHFYDADFCMQFFGLKKNYVVYDIVVEHFSQGKYDPEFLKQAEIFANKWSKKLPTHLDPLTSSKVANLEGYMMAKRLQLMKSNGYSVICRLKIIGIYFRKYGNIYQMIRSIYFGFLTKKVA